VILKITLEDGSYILLACNPFHFYQSIQVSDYKLRSLWYWLGGALLPLFFPNVLEKMMWYIVSISGALAILNIAPTYFLDGAYACHTLIRVLFPDETQFHLRERVVSWIFRFTMILFVLNIILTFSVI